MLLCCLCGARPGRWARTCGLPVAAAGDLTIQGCLVKSATVSLTARVRFVTLLAGDLTAQVRFVKLLAGDLTARVCFVKSPPVASRFVINCAVACFPPRGSAKLELRSALRSLRSVGCEPPFVIARPLGGRSNPVLQDVSFSGLLRCRYAPPRNDVLRRASRFSQ